MNTPKGYQTDHINSDGLDNRRSNLRNATHAQNQWNKGKSASNTSGYKGLVWNKKNKCWMARIRCNGKRYYLGSYRTAVEAAQAYTVAAKQLHKEYAHKSLEIIL